MIYADLETRINTPLGNEILLLKREPQDKIYDKTVLLIGGFHGDEPSGEYLIERYLSSKTFTKNRLLFVPCLNPDGKSKNSRTNANEVDLNRNFPTANWQKSENDEYFGGETPASEVETQFMVYIVEKYAPDLIITFHEPYQIVNFDGPAEEEAQKISDITNYQIQKSIGYPTPGSFGSYCGVERKIPTITLELSDKSSNDDLWNITKDIFTYIQESY